MQIVIDIDEETYKKCKWKNNGVVGLEWWERAIAKGTPLPKGHGRLIDDNEKELIKGWSTYAIDKALTVLEDEIINIIKNTANKEKQNEV